MLKYWQLTLPLTLLEPECGEGFKHLKTYIYIYKFHGILKSYPSWKTLVFLIIGVILSAVLIVYTAVKISCDFTKAKLIPFLISFEPFDCMMTDNVLT